MNIFKIFHKFGNDILLIDWYYDEYSANERCKREREKGILCWVEK